MLMDEPSEEDGGADSHSYIVPYGLKGEQSPSGIPITRLCIVVDAVTGEFEEVATFGKPIAYLQREAGSGASHTRRSIEGNRCITHVRILGDHTSPRLSVLADCG